LKFNITITIIALALILLVTNYIYGGKSTTYTYVPIQPRGVFVGSAWSLHLEPSQITATSTIFQPVKNAIITKKVCLPFHFSDNKDICQTTINPN
jgi:hypothetical protein